MSNMLGPTISLFQIIATFLIAVTFFTFLVKMCVIMRRNLGVENLSKDIKSLILYLLILLCYILFGLLFYGALWITGIFISSLASFVVSINIVDDFHLYHLNTMPLWVP